MIIEVISNVSAYNFRNQQLSYVLRLNGKKSAFYLQKTDKNQVSLGKTCMLRGILTKANGIEFAKNQRC